MPPHPPHLAPAAIEHRVLKHILLLHGADAHGAPVRPHPTRHVVARAEQNVRQVRRPRYPAHGVLVAWQHGDGARGRHPDVEGADRAVDAGGRDDRVAVLVPVVREGFRGRQAHGCGGAHTRFRRRVDRHAHGEVVACACGGAEIKDAQVAVRGDAAEYTGTVRAEGRAVGARVRGQGSQAGRGIWVPDLDCAVPRRGEERVFCDEVPVHSEDFARVLGPRLHGELREGDVEELYGAVAARGEDLVLVRFRPCAVKEGVLRVKPGEQRVSM